MQASQPQPGSSFINREQLAKQIEASQKNAKTAEAAALTPAAAAEPAQEEVTKAEAEEEKKEGDRYKDFLEYKTACESELEAELTDDDIRAVIFKSSVTKELTVVPGFLRGCFRTLTAEDVGSIDEEMSAFVKANPDLLPQAVANERAKVLLSWAWISAGAENELRSLGASPKDRRVTLNKMSATIVEEAAKTWSTFDNYMRLSLRSKTVLKKS